MHTRPHFFSSSFITAILRKSLNSRESQLGCGDRKVIRRWPHACTIMASLRTRGCETGVKYLSRNSFVITTGAACSRLRSMHREPGGASRAAWLGVEGLAGQDSAGRAGAGVRALGRPARWPGRAKDSVRDDATRAGLSRHAPCRPANSSCSDEDTVEQVLSYKGG